MRNLKLLIIDDIPDQANRVATVARRVDLETRVAENAKDFMELYRILQPDLIVMEIILEDMDGLELIMWLQDQNASAHLLIHTGFNLAYTQMAEILISRRGSMTGEVLHKPIDDEPLRRALEKARTTFDSIHRTRTGANMQALQLAG